MLPTFPPFGSMFDDPIRQGMFKTDVIARLFRLNPFVLQYLFPLCLKFPIQRGVLNQIIAAGTFALTRHKSFMIDAFEFRNCNSREIHYNKISAGSDPSGEAPDCKYHVTRELY
jgi:hypothetical protein